MRLVADVSGARAIGAWRWHSGTYRYTGAYWKKNPEYDTESSFMTSGHWMVAPTDPGKDLKN